MKKLEITVDPIRVVDKALRHYNAQKAQNNEPPSKELSRQVVALAVVLCQEIHENIKIQ